MCTGYQRDRHFKNLSSLDHDSILARSQPLVPNTEPSFIQYEMKTSASSPILRKNDIGLGTFSLPNDRIFACFMGEYMSLKLDRSKLDDEPPLSWMQIIPYLKRSHRSLDNALAALSMVRLGRKLNDEKLKKRGIALYGQALEGMQEALTNVELLRQDQTLASCLTMAIFEVSNIYLSRHLMC